MGVKLCLSFNEDCALDYCCCNVFSLSDHNFGEFHGIILFLLISEIIRTIFTIIHNIQYSKVVQILDKKSLVKQNSCGNDNNTTQTVFEVRSKEQ